MINIGYAGHTLCRPMTGVGRYLQSLSQIESTKINKVAFVPNHNIQVDNCFDELVFSDKSSRIGKLLWSYNHMLSTNSKFDIYHSPQMFLPFFTNKNIQKIVTIHDLLFLDMPFLYSKFERTILNLSLRDAVNRADTFICISKYTYSRFKNYFPNKKNVEVIYNCLSMDKISNTLESKNKDCDKYFILPSNRTPRKNIVNTVLAYKKSLFYKNGYKLLICGPMDGAIDIEYDYLIRDVGYVDEVELELLYKNSEGLLFFSLGEGFGYPIVEAASFSVPVLAAANTSIIELFDGRTDLLCTDYFTVDGIVAFLDKYYKSYEMKFQILQVLEKTLRLFSKDVFSDQLLSLYSVK